MQHTTTQAAAQAAQPMAAPKPRRKGSTLYERAVDVVRKRGRIDAAGLASYFHISEHQATGIISRMWDNGVITSQSDMFGSCTCREGRRDD